MERCVQSLGLTGPCAGHGARAKDIRRALFRRGSYCAVCAAGMELRVTAVPPKVVHTALTI